MRNPIPVFLAAILVSLCAPPADAAPLSMYKNKVVWMTVHSNYTGAHQLIDGVKVYTEGPAHLVITVLGQGGRVMNFSLPLGDGKAEAILGLAQAAMAAGKEVQVFYSSDLMAYRSTCANFDAKGCIELSKPEPHFALGYITFHP